MSEAARNQHVGVMDLKWGHLRKLRCHVLTRTMLKRAVFATRAQTSIVVISARGPLLSNTSAKTSFSTIIGTLAMLPIEERPFTKRIFKRLRARPQPKDEAVGEIIAVLDNEVHLKDSTAVVFCSDQGAFLGEHGRTDKRLM